MEQKQKKDKGAEREQAEKVADKRAAKIREEMEDRLERLRYQYERELNNFRYEIQERDYRLKAYEDKFNKIKEPPLLYAYVVRKAGEDLSGNQVVVARASEMLKVSVGFIDKEGLAIGQYVWVHPQTYAIVEESQEVHKGIVGKVQEVQEANLFDAVGTVRGEHHVGVARCRRLRIENDSLDGDRPGRPVLPARPYHIVVAAATEQQGQRREQHRRHEDAGVRVIAVSDFQRLNLRGTRTIEALPIRWKLNSLRDLGNCPVGLPTK